MFSIWAEPATKDAKYLFQIICKLGKKYHSHTFNPHITMYSGIRSVSDAKLAIQNCKNMGKFTVMATGLDFSDSLWKTVFVNVEKNQRLEQIHDTVKENIRQSTQYRFNPHISLIYKKMSNSEKQEIIDGLRIKQKFTFDKIAVITSSRNVEKWEVIDRVVLK
ncbi:2'-5' RNA ligase family protein [Candidatus Nitrosotenuis chungbukensis]|uniref:2'-5' RNA ligase family protein n=1 Tax=Candidatus Nitrosotenuis chungbukensis TaxID=1353246 RepID=UPI0005B2C185|nr:2'-5' RNA ligase family protein [Candidatus Nitrosotenuis chungbukensis]WKT57441.1 2'-5' RNA ligase family protein [Candidatus Nitrosotenuis chungbukensis]